MATTWAGAQPGRALLDGEPMELAAAALAITDDGVARGDGAFETIGVWGGRPYRVADHLERLERSLRAIALPPVDPDLLAAEVTQLLTGVAGDALVRIYATAGGTRLLTVAPQPQRPRARRLEPQPAPWIRPLGTYGPAGAKTMSYGPNMAATRAAQRAGADDALLIAQEGWILEGPTFCVLWVAGRTLHAPELELGVVDSISRRTIIGLAQESGLDCVQGRWRLDALRGADEVLVCSAARPVTGLRQVGDLVLPEPSGVADALERGVDAARRG